MRISTAQMFHSGVSAMQRAQADLNHTSMQMSTGRRILTPSDDPNGAAQSTRLQAVISTTEQHQRNVDSARAGLEQEEGIIDSFETALQRARELVLQSGNDTNNQENRKTIAKELREIRDHIFGLANTKMPTGEFLFAGTDSHTQPFAKVGSTGVSYAAASGPDDVRRLAVTETRAVRVGDAGSTLFMDVPEATGRRLEGVFGALNTGDLVLEGTEIADRKAFDLTPEASFTIRFKDNAGTMEYEVLDSQGSPVLDAQGDPITGTYQAGQPITFAGRSLTLSGTPGDGDTVVSRPASSISIFETLDSIATALERPVSDDKSRAALKEAVADSLLNMDSTLSRANEVRASVGLRLGELDAQEGINAQRLVDLKATLSDIQDLDYAEAVSRYKLQEIVLQAAQQTYTQTSRLSLFDFL